MALNPQPQTADNIIKFDGTAGRASILRYDVAAPGQFRGRRILRLDLALEPADVLESAISLTPTVTYLKWRQEGKSWKYDKWAAWNIWFNKANEAWKGAVVLSLPMKMPLDVLQSMTDTTGRTDPTGSSEYLIIPPPGSFVGASVFGQFGATEIGRQALESILSLYTAYVNGLVEGRLVLPARRWDGVVVGVTTYAADVLSTAPSDANFFLIEVYGISTFLGDYGLGRTVRTFTLLPGEETKISMKVWQTDTTKVSQATSIVDSYDEKSASRFNDTVQSETTDKKTRNDKSSWHAEAEVSASWGWGNAKVSGGAAGENQTGREEFSKDVINSVKEHSAEAASNRTNTVSLSTETERVVGMETATERTIRNINLRRVLNFVFRELNQQYTTVVHLIEVKVGFATSSTDSYREAPISGLRSLLETALFPSKVDEVAKQILSLATLTTGKDGTPVTTLEKLDLNPDSSYRVATAVPDAATGQLPAPPSDRSFLYRWKPGPLNQQSSDSRYRVDGVVMAETTVVMPTADIVVEALLGQADALDEFAMSMQSADAEAKALGNRRATLALDTLEGITGYPERAEAWSKIFPPAQAND
jgi:hypothetical protein